MKKIKIGYPNIFKRSNGIWSIQYSRDKRRSIRTRDESIARAVLQQAIRKMLDSKLLSIEKVKSIMLDDFIREYIEKRELMDIEPRTVDNDRLAFRRFREIVGNQRLRKIDRADVDRFKLSLLREGRAKGYINSLLRSLTTGFTYAMKEAGYITVNPFIKSNRHDNVYFKMDEQLPKFISPDNIEGIFSAISSQDMSLYADDKGFWHLNAGGKDKHLGTRKEFRAREFFADEKRRRDDFYLAVKIYLYTGMRRSELIRLNRQDIDLRNGLIYIRDTKSKKDRAVPIHDDLRLLLENVHEGIGKLFPRWSSADVMTALFRKYADKAGVSATLHHLRHSFGSYLSMAGEDINKIQKLMGHRDIKTTQIYAKVNTESLRSTIGKLNYGK